MAVPTSVSAQYQIKGQVLDESGNGLAYATAVLLQASDSVMQQYSLTGNDGQFAFGKVMKGSYLLQLTFVGMETQYRPLNVSDDVDLGSISMKKQTARLPELEVTGKRTPVVVKEDTVEYNAEAFKTQPNANVEELLKKLPGVEVDRDGNIKAQGEDVEKVLVDGKSFFGDDPKIATKNLPADAVDKVQVFDKQSETAEFSGIDDGERIKTINLQLKEGKRHGHFGTAEGGFGIPENRYLGKLTMNRFSRKKQFSAIGLSNNISEQGFSMKDYVTFMGGFRNLMESGMVTFGEGGPSVSLGLDQKSGITTSHAVGLNLNDDLGKKSDLYSSYFFNRIINFTSKEATRSYFNQGFDFTSTSNTNQDIVSDNHRLNLRFKQNIDSLQDIQLVSTVKYNDGRTSLSSAQQNIGVKSSSPSTYTANYSGNGSEVNADNEVIWRKKFRKAGRFLTARGSGQYDLARRRMELNSTASASDTLVLPSSISNQNQVSYNATITYEGRLSYTEPLRKGRYLEWHAVFGGTQAQNSKDFYDMVKAPNELDKDLSSSFAEDYSYYNGGMNLKINRSQFNLVFGASVQNSMLIGHNNYLATADVTRHYVSLLPAMHMSWRPATGRHMRLDYRASEQAPDITQLQPVVENSNPAEVYSGNPDLQNEKTHTIRAFFMSFNQYRFSTSFAHINARYTLGKIVNDVRTDSALVQLIYPVNTDYELSISASTGYSTPIRKLDIKINLGPGIYLSEGFQPIIGDMLPVQHLNPFLDVSVENRRKNHFDLLIGSKITLNTTTFRDALMPNQQFITKDMYSDMVIYVGDKWQVTGSFDYYIFGGQSFDSNEYLKVLDAGISHILLKEDRGQLKFSVKDILNEGQGISRTSTLNYLEESHTNALGRYYMVSFLYSLNGFGREKGGMKRFFTGGGRRH